jgi:hypothetical protein
MNNPPNVQDWSSLYKARRRVIACATVIEEMLPFLPADVSSDYSILACIYSLLN